MLLRQLHRPSSRSVAAAAAVAWQCQWQWQASHTALLHNSTSRLQPPPPSPPPQQQQNNAKDQDQDQEQEQDQDAAPKKPKNRPSLFEQLFPDEAKTLLNKNTTPKPSWAEHLLDDPPQPPSPSPSPSPSDEEGNNVNDDIGNDGRKSPADVPLRAKSMLILSAASKHLTESDFQRLGPQGAHVEGWVGGLSRVIQARDPDTLQALGHYFVLFDREAAAAAYCDEVERLWQLGKAHVPGAHHRRRNNNNKRGRASSSSRRHPTSSPSPASVPPPPGLPAADGSSEDVAADLRAFTLVPPSQRYYLDVSSGFSRVRIEELDVGGVAFVDRLADRAGSKHLVLVSVDGGRMSVDWLRRAIEEDGRERNLPWGVTSLERGILPFGKSVLKKQLDDMEQQQQQQQEEVDGSFEGSLLDQAERIAGKPEWLEGQSDGVGGGEKGKAMMDDDGGGYGGKTAAGGEGKTLKEDDDRKYRRYPRFIIPFVDNAEAHRFVRHWHRRHFKIRMSIAGEKPISWDETRILNTTVLW
ncbi:uncharacterized protein F4812DRAFT_424760 [Daldinia caldariorum]|uniref:uncharacterized protein n=1 Tax=Daldinia caldariorum TaxID=326644 RepID=UPI002007426E|nr:uncharacterized protein F4812DRAFT_424760 [Daldinia caldariorum]KAI1468796.1 hypothetical protein F4812DRAFT_424760 [Daldinia caldariorum]